jgi:hypothetical protein
MGRWIDQQAIEIKDKQIGMSFQKLIRLKPLSQSIGPTSLFRVRCLWVEGGGGEQHKESVRVLVHHVAHP